MSLIIKLIHNFLKSFAHNFSLFVELLSEFLDQISNLWVKKSLFYVIQVL